MSISQLPQSTIKLITSSQIITSVASVVKELIENSLDAGATSLDVKLVNNGLDRIEVKDNGCGINKADTSCMALPHYTSKISDFKDLERVTTYGFRGEALNAICQVSQVTVTTVTSSDPLAMTYTLDAGGNIVSSKPSHHSQGTTVSVSNLFKNLPVRRQYVGSGRKLQEELKQVENIVKSLAVIKPKCRVTLAHNKCLIWQKNPSSSLHASFCQMVGYSYSQQLELLSFKTPSQITVDMLVPKINCDIEGLCKATPSTSLVFINERIVTYKKIIKVLHQQLASCFSDKFPSRKYVMCLISVSTPPTDLDINLNPSKTQVLLKDEDTFLKHVEKRLMEYYHPKSCIKNHEDEVNRPGAAEEAALNSKDDLSEGETSRKRPKLDYDSKISLNLGKPQENTRKQDDCSMKKRSSLGVHWNNPLGQNKETECIALNERNGNNKESLHNQSESVFQQSCTTIEEGCNQTEISASVTVTGKTDVISNGINSNILEDNEFDLPGSDDIVKFPDKNQANLCEENKENSYILEDNEFDLSRNDDIAKFPDENQANLCEENKKTADKSKESYEFVEAVMRNENIKMINSSVSKDNSDNIKFTSPPPFENADVSVDLFSDDFFSPQRDSTLKPVDLDAWSKGHIQGGSGNLLQGACVLAHGGEPNNEISTSDKNSSPPSRNNRINQLTRKGLADSLMNHFAKDSSNCSNQTGPSSPKHHSFLKSKIKKSPRSSEVGDGVTLDSSLLSVSSQMGRRELSAFTKFAREARPQIILQNPGIAFTRVASLLAEQWRELPSEEKERYEEIARQAATNRKVWQTADRQRTLDWIKELPSKPEETTRNLNEKESSTNGNKFGRKEVVCEYTMDSIKLRSSKIDSSKMLRSYECPEADTILLLGQLEPSGSWVCMEGPEICLLSHCRLQEVVVYHRLLETFSLPLKLLPVQEIINQEILGKEAWNMLRSLESKSEVNALVITADVISKNGLRIEFHEGGDTAAITHVAETINFYGLRELKEILELVQLSSPIKLSSCRPLRVVNHIKGETMRICRKSPSTLERAMIEELFHYWTSKMHCGNRKCLHFEPILTPIFNLATKEKHERLTSLSET